MNVTKKVRTFYRYYVTHMNSQQRLIRPTGVTFRIDLQPDENKIRFSAAVSNLGSKQQKLQPDHFVRASGRHHADDAWNKGQIYEVIYSSWPSGSGVVDIIYDALAGLDLEGGSKMEPYATFVKEPENAARFKTTIRQRLEFPQFTGTTKTVREGQSA